MLPRTHAPPRTGSIPRDHARGGGSAKARGLYQASLRGGGYDLTRFGSPKPGLYRPLMFATVIWLFIHRTVDEHNYDMYKLQASKSNACPIYFALHNVLSMHSNCEGTASFTKNQHVLCSISKLSTSFWKIVHTPYIKLPKEL